jgi:putative DNA primase/helicase
MTDAISPANQTKILGPKDFPEIFIDSDAWCASEASLRENEIIPLIRPGSLADIGGPTEESLAREWVIIHHKNWRFDPILKCYYRWDGALWKRDDQNLAFHMIGEHMREAGTPKKPLGKASMARGIDAFVQANPQLGILHDEWDKDPFLLGTPGGTVDLRTGEIRKPDQMDYITRSTSVTPKAGEATRWLQFMDECTGSDPALVKFLQQILGYCLTGSTREHALFFAYGAGKNGKSVLLNTASRIIGNYAVTAAMDTFVSSQGDKHPTELARLDGARLVAASETEEGRKWADARIKQLTGGDVIAARFMKKDFFEFLPKFKLFIVGNHQPVLHNVDEATRRRFNIIPFLHVPQQPDMELESKLAAEHPQILAWMIEGAKDWFANGLTRPQAVIGATNRYFENQDMIGQWLGERCDVRPGAMGKAKDLFESWRQFASENGEMPGSQRAFGDVLEKRDFIRDRNSSIGRFHSGVDVRKVTRNQHMP